MKLNEATHIDSWFEKAFTLRERVFDDNFILTKMSYLKKTIYLKLKYVEILIEK